MCGICGIAQAERGAHVDLAPLRRMNGALRHRGPDDAGEWNGGRAALAMCRLSVIDLASGRQPMTSDDGTLALVFNGEIYNFRELRAELQGLGHVFRTNSDTEVILRAYERHGCDAVRHFNGMFAFALYDARAERLIIARDRLGEKPLFYTFAGGTLAFASELDALLRSGLVDGRLNAAALDDFFAYLYVPAPDTIFTNVHKLRPGHMLVFERGELRTEPYWMFAPAPDRTWTLDSAAERFRELLTDAVRLRRVSDVPLGAFLSGGIDSSAVVGLLSEQSSKPVKTITIGFDDAHADEMKYARIAAKRFGTDHTETLLRPDMISVGSELARHFGEPFADSSAVPTWLVSQVARRDVTVALSGDGGDELFAGYTWTHMTRLVNEYARRVPGAVRRLIGAGLQFTSRSPFTAKLRRFHNDAQLPPRERFRRRHLCFDLDARLALYSPELRRRVGDARRDRFGEHAEAAPPGLPFDDWMLYHDTVMYLPDDILTKVDRMSMAHALEARVPLLDHRLVEFAGTVPFDLKLQGGMSKRLVKHALRDLLPEELTAQRKQGFAIPVHRWLREDLGGHFEEVVLAADARAPRLLKRTRIQALFDAHAGGRENYGHHLWALLMFEHWLRYAEKVPGLTLR